MSTKYRITNAIVELVNSAWVRSNVLVNNKTLPEHERREQTFAMNRELREALDQIRRYDD